MGTEKERKFLLCSDLWKNYITKSQKIVQGYLSRDKERCVRIRLCERKAYITVKGASKGFSRPEFEYEIPLMDGEELLRLCLPPVIEKIRHFLSCGGFCWIIDEFGGHRQGLITAEFEYDEDERFPAVLPEWIGEEVTGKPEYYNSNMF